MSLERAIRSIIREEIARALAEERRSRARSGSGIGALVLGDQCDDKARNESMDHTDTATDGESSSPEQIAARLLNRSRHRPKRRESPLRLEPKQKAGR
jgi:hypothetical protein